MGSRARSANRASIPFHLGVVLVAKYLWLASYTADGIKGVLKEGGSGRRDAIEKLVADLGGTLDAFYFSFGEDDVYVIADLPDNTTAAAVSLAVGASGAVRIKTAVLLTPEEVDRAVHTTVAYRAPGK
jgi:uncharacterized protein with GYD domain